MSNADDELASCWNLLRPPKLIELPTQLQTQKPPPPWWNTAFCTRCGLPRRLCNESKHGDFKTLSIGDALDAEKRLFHNLSRGITKEEIADLRPKLVLFDRTPYSDFKVMTADKEALIQAGRIPLSVWRLQLYRDIFGREE